MLGGRRSRALRHFHKAVSIASRLGMAYERALGLVELGKGASSDYEKARGCSRAAQRRPRPRHAR